MAHRAIAVLVAAALMPGAGASCKTDEPPKRAPMQTPRLPPVEGWDAKTTGGGAGPGLPAVTVTDAATATGSGAGTGTGTGTGSGTGTSTGSGTGTGTGTGTGSAAATGTIPDCDVTIALTETRAEWTGGATGSTAVSRGHVEASPITKALAKLDDTRCRVHIRPDDGVRQGLVIAAMEAVVAEKSFRISLVTAGGARIIATTPSSGAAGTAVRDAKTIAIGKRDVRVGDQPAVPLGDANLATKVGAALSTLQAGTRGIMVIVKVDDATPFKLVGAVLTGAKNAGFDSVVFRRG